jgi:CheY-like chemotaxis protein
MSAKRALIVDDSRSARTFLTRILERYDLQVDGAASAEEAIEYLIRHCPDVIFLDHLMPGMDGFQALAAIKTNPRTATIPVMMYTSQEGELYLSQARALGAMGVLPKQTRPADVSLALEKLRLLGERRPESEIATVRVPSLRDDGEFHEDATGPAALDSLEPPVPVKSPVVQAAPEMAASLPPVRGPAGSPSAGLTPEMRAQLEVLLRDHGSELRRFVAQSLAQQSGQIISELRTLLDGAATPAVAAEPLAAAREADRRGVSVLWLGVVAALIAALAGLLWYRSAGEQGGVGAGQEQPRSSTAPAPTSGATRPIVAPDKPAAKAAVSGAAGNVRPAPLLVVPVPFGEAPFSGARIDAVQAALARLVAAGFRGSVELRSFPGRYCLQGAGDTVALPAGELSYSKCDQIGNPVDATGAAGHESVDFANMVSAARSRSHGALDVQLSSGNADEVITPYPPVTAFLTTGEWNRAAATNNRVEVRTRPQP